MKNFMLFSNLAIAAPVSIGDGLVNGSTVACTTERYIDSQT